jgi:hypothetical protein
VASGNTDIDSPIYSIYNPGRKRGLMIPVLYQVGFDC